MVSKKSRYPIGLITELFTNASRGFKEKFLVMVFEALRDQSERQELDFEPEALPEDFSLRSFVDSSEWTPAMLYEAVHARELADVINILFNLVQLAERLKIKSLAIEPAVGEPSDQDEKTGSPDEGDHSREKSQKERVFRHLEEKIGAPLDAKKLDDYFRHKDTTPSLLAMELGPGISAQDIEEIVLELRKKGKEPEPDEATKPGPGEKPPSVPEMLKKELGEEPDSVSVEGLRDDAGGHKELAARLNEKYGGKATATSLSVYLSSLRRKEERKSSKATGTSSDPGGPGGASPETVNKIRDTEVPG